MTDSAGRSWAGRSFEASAWSGDDGSAPPAYVAALGRFRSGTAGPEVVVDALRGVRLLVPLLAGLAEADEATGADKKAELALVTVAGPDGRRVLPAFSSADTMRAWNPSARPVPAPARQVALGAAGDGTELVIVDPASPERFGLRRSALEALARDLPWSPPWDDPLVVAALGRAVEGEDEVSAVRVGPGDPAATLDGAEVRVVLVLRGTPDRPALGRLLARVQRRWAEDTAVRARVDSLSVGLDTA